MKKIILILVLLSGMSLASPYTSTLGKIENVLYGFQYDTEADENRMQRIETTVYGKNNSGTIQQRLDKLKKDISADQIGKEITPSEDTFAEKDTIEEELKADSNIKYPAVDELEMRTFNKVTTDKDIKTRLSTLEQKIFGKVYTDDLSTRVDRLKAEVRPTSFMDNAIAQSSNDFFDDDPIELERNYHLDRYESPNQFDYEQYNSQAKSRFLGKKPNLTNIENSVLRRSFQNDTMDNRLNRLENAMFGTEFSEDDEQTRTARISSAYKAHKNASKYDSNRFSRNMTTAVQIGTILLMVLACIL